MQFAPERFGDEEPYDPPFDMSDKAVPFTDIAAQSIKRHGVLAGDVC